MMYALLTVSWPKSDEMENFMEDKCLELNLASLQIWMEIKYVWSL